MALSTGLTATFYGLATLLVIAELVLSAYVVAVISDYNQNLKPWQRPYYFALPSELVFNLFNSIWSLLVIAYIVAANHWLQGPGRLHAVFAFALSFLTSMFWLAGSVAFVVRFRDWASQPTRDPRRLPRTLQSSIATGFIIWISFSILTVVQGLRARKANIRTK